MSGAAAGAAVAADLTAGSSAAVPRSGAEPSRPFAYYGVLTTYCQGAVLKQVVTFRLDPGLLAKARYSAQRENRTLTNFVETLLKQAVEGCASDSGQTPPPDSGRPS